MTYFWQNPALSFVLNQPLGVDEDAARELEIYIDNDARFSPQGSGIGRSVAQNLLKKMRRGTYDARLAPKGWQPVVDAAAKEYAHEFDEPSRWHQLFSAITRRYVANEIAAAFQAAAERGEYAHLERR